MWNLLAWVGIAALFVLAFFLLRFIYEVIEAAIVSRIGWERLYELGFLRAIPASFRRRKR